MAMSSLTFTAYSFRHLRLSVAHARTAALCERTKHLIAWQRGHEFEKIPFALRFRGRLDLDHIDVMHHAAVRPQSPVRRERVLHWRLAHFGDHHLGIVRVGGLG